MNHCHDCNSDYARPGSCNCFAPGGKRYAAPMTIPGGVQPYVPPAPYPTPITIPPTPVPWTPPWSVGTWIMTDETPTSVTFTTTIAQDRTYGGWS